jgi:hypothetical protein
LIDLRDNTTGDPEFDAALLYNRIEADPNSQIRADTASIYAHRVGTDANQRFDRLTKRIQISHKTPMEDLASVRRTFAREAMAIKGVSFDRKAEVLDRLCRYNKPDAVSEAIDAGKALLNDSSNPLDERRALLDKLVRSPQVNTRVVAVQLAGTMTELGTDNLVELLRIALADGTARISDSDKSTLPTSASPMVAIKATEVIVDCAALSDSDKLDLLQSGIGERERDVSLHRARAALAVATGKALDFVIGRVDLARERDPAVRAEARRWLAEQTGLTPATARILADYVDRVDQ